MGGAPQAGGRSLNPRYHRFRRSVNQLAADRLARLTEPRDLLLHRMGQVSILAVPAVSHVETRPRWDATHESHLSPALCLSETGTPA